MADAKISQLPVASTPLAGTELVPVVQGGATEQTTVEAILTGTVPSGTANGVLYLDGSKVVTSGSALTFDGSTFSNVQGSGTAALSFNQLSFSRNGANYLTATLSSLNYGASQHIFGNNDLSSEWMRLTSTGLGIGTDNPGAKLEIAQSADTTDGPKLRIANNGNTLSNGQLIGGIDFFDGDDSGEGVGAYIYSYTTDSIGRSVGQDLRFATGATETMRLDSSGNLGIGTSSPGNKLHVQGSGDVARFTNGTNSAYFALDSAGFTLFTGAGQTGNGLYAKASDNSVQLWTNSSVKATLDSSGNVGIGATPSAWGSGTTALEVGAVYSKLSSSGTYGGALTNNAYYNSGWKYEGANFATLYLTAGGVHSWHTAASGTAGDPISFTQAMTLDASGSLLVGSTSGTYRLSISVSSGADRDIFLAGVTGTSNGFHVRWINSTGKTHVIIADIPTSSAGLSAGTLWNDGGTLKIA